MSYLAILMAGGVIRADVWDLGNSETSHRFNNLIS